MHRVLLLSYAPVEMGQQVLRADVEGEIKVHKRSKLFIQNSLFRNAKHPFHTIEELGDATRFPAPILAPGRGGDFVYRHTKNDSQNVSR
jgi:hypothetical protein